MWVNKCTIQLHTDAGLAWACGPIATRTSTRISTRTVDADLIVTTLMIRL